MTEDREKLLTEMLLRLSRVVATMVVKAGTDVTLPAHMELLMTDDLERLAVLTKRLDAAMKE